MRTIFWFAKLVLFVMLSKMTHQNDVFTNVHKITSGPALKISSTVKNVVQQLLGSFDPHFIGWVYLDNVYASKCRMKPIQSDHGVEIYDCEHMSYTLDEFKSHSSFFFPYPQFHSIDFETGLFEQIISMRFFHHYGTLVELRMMVNVLDHEGFINTKRAIQKIVLSVKPPYENAKSSSSVLCNVLNEKVGMLNAYKNDELKSYKEAVAENNKKIRELEQKISELNSEIEEKENELSLARTDKETSQIILIEKKSELSSKEKSIEDLKKKKVRLVKVSNGELNSDIEHQMLTLKERTRCNYLKYQDAIELLVPFETHKTQCSMKEIVENLNFEKGKQCIVEIVS